MHADLRILDLQVRRDVLEGGNAAQHTLELGGVLVQRVDVRALQRELIQRFGRAAADPDGLRQRQVRPDPGDLTELCVELPRDLVGRQPLGPRLESNAHAALVHRAATDRGHVVGDVGILPHDVRDLELVVAHALERGALERFRGALDLPLVFGGDEALRDSLVED